jgi:hypothetical protein
MTRNNETIGCVSYLATFAFLMALDGVMGEIVEHGYSEGDARQYLEQVGYSNEKLIDEDTILVGFQGCDQTDAVKYEFMATAPNGTAMRVMVCNGLFKGATIRQGGV